MIVSITYWASRLIGHRLVADQCMLVSELLIKNTRSQGTPTAMPTVMTVGHADGHVVMPTAMPKATPTATATAMPTVVYLPRSVANKENYWSGKSMIRRFPEQEQYWPGELVIRKILIWEITERTNVGTEKYWSGEYWLLIGQMLVREITYQENTD